MRTDIIFEKLKNLPNFCHVLLDCGKTNNFCQDGYFLDEKGAFEESYEPSLDMIR